MLHRSTIQLLRFHFSAFLLPVYLFALSETGEVNWPQALLMGAVLHLLVYPSSNGYNSYMDRDETPIGGLQHPMRPTRQLYHVTLLLDALTLLISIWAFGGAVTLGILCYILASRAYSSRKIRLKQHPYIGFATVFVCQGALVFWATAKAADSTGAVAIIPCITSSFLIGALYPLTQIYQHDSDLKDGVVTISYKLGKRGSFVFSGILFSIAAALLFYWYGLQGRLNDFYLFLLTTIPVLVFFGWWLQAVWKNANRADFGNSLRMNIIATACTILFFSILIYIHHFE